MKSRTVLGSLLLVVGLGTAVSASAPGRSVPDPVTRFEAFFAKGPTARYTSASGSLSSPQPVTMSVPDDAARYDAVVTVTAQYVAEGEGPWTIGVAMNRASRPQPLATRPGDYLLEETRPGRPGTTTVRFLVSRLVGGADYSVAPTVDSTTSESPEPSRVATRKVVVTVELTPAG